MIKNDSQAPSCTCPSGDGSLVHPCPAHPAVEQAGGDERASKPGLFCRDCGSRLMVRGVCSIYCPNCVKAQARAALAQPSPVRSSLLINGYQLRAALDFIAPDGTAEQLESEACIEWRQQDADFLEAGLYAFCAEYPEEGGVLLDEEPTNSQPSPAQELAERGTQHRFSTTEQTCRHDFAGVWWNDNGETKTGKECRECGFFIADIAEAPELERPEPVVRAYGVLPPFAEKVLAKLRRFYDCAEDFESGGVDIGRHWLDLLTQLGLLNRVQRSPALWEISQHGEDLLEAPVAQAQHSVPEGWKLVPVDPTEDLLEAIHNGGYVGDDRELRQFYQAILDAAPAPGGE
ncbi:hypothetical protein ACUHM9_004979 [Pseudomonas aeruginosa]